MNLIKHILISITYIIGIGCFRTDLLKAFFKHKNLKNGVIISCQSKLENILLHREMANLFLSVQNIDKDLNATINLLKTLKQNKMAIIVHMNYCRNSFNLLEEISLFNVTYTWLLVDHSSVFDFDKVSSLNINVDTEMYAAVKNSYNQFTLYELYHTGKHQFGSLKMNNIGEWNAANGLILDNRYKYVRRSNMTGVKLKCMIVITSNIHNQTLMHFLQSKSHRHIDSMNRFNFHLLVYVKEMFNFTYVMSRTNTWGYLQKNGEFNGMIGYLEKKLVDIGGSPIFFRAERSKIIDSTIQTWISRPCFIFRHPKRMSVFQSYIRPFESYVWYSAGCLMAVVTLCMYVLTTRDVGNGGAHNTTWSTSLLYTLGVLFQQGISLRVESISSKILLLSHFLFAILFYQYYSASIVSSLLMRPHNSMKNLKDLLTSDLEVGLENIPYNLDYFNRTTDLVAIKLYRSKIVTKDKTNLYYATQGIKKVKAGGFAFHIDTATAYPIIRKTFTEREVCDLAEIPLFPAQSCVSIVQKGSAYRKLISYGLRKTAENGIMSKQRQMWYESRPKCENHQSTAHLQVTIKEFSPILIFLTAGMILSLLILFLEILHHNLIIYIAQRNHTFPQFQFLLIHSH